MPASSHIQFGHPSSIIIIIIIFIKMIVKQYKYNSHKEQTQYKQTQ